MPEALEADCIREQLPITLNVTRHGPARVPSIMRWEKKFQPQIMLRPKASNREISHVIRCNNKQTEKFQQQIMARH